MIRTAANDADHELAERLRAALGELVRRVKTGDELPDAHAVVLGLLDREGPKTIAALAVRAYVRHQSMTQVVELLRKRGQVETSRHPSDRRALLVQLTAEGRDVLDQERSRRAARTAAIIAETYPSGERDKLMDAVAVIEALARS